MNELTEGDLPEFLRVNRYGPFVLTHAIRPAAGVPIVPETGYAVRVHRDRHAQVRLPMLTASVTAELVFEVFLDLVERLGPTCHCVIESSHGRSGDDHIDFRREWIDTPVLLSHLHDFEELLLHDGCTGLAVLHPRLPMEVQFDEHKELIVYAPKLTKFEAVLQRYGVPQRRSLATLSQAEHFHRTSDRLREQFELLATRLGVANFERVLTDESPT